ncbi:MAG: polyphosphate kinase 1, partial [Chitinophagales bacterium]
KLGRPVRFIHDKDIDKGLLNFLVNRMNIDAKEDSVIAGGRYHNSKDFMGFPNLGTNELRDTKRKPLPHPDIDPKKSLFKMIRKKDIMLHFPYQSFHPIIDFLREAAIDSKVEYIKVTIYRLAKQSNIINALINARKNGKKVTAAIELQARFDEAANIAWAKTLQENGIKVVHGQPGQKIHSKILLVGRRERGKIKSYVSIGTGNFHEGTAKLYSDDNLLTSNSKITKEVERVFRMIETGIPEKFKHLLVSPHDMYPKLLGFIDAEIANAKAGKEAYLLAKLNSLNDEGMIDKLYEASQAGVKIRLIIRGICCLLPERTGLSENIEAISIVDKYLEHSRCYIFCNGGDEKVFISSADWMERNLHRRIEVSCPIYDPQIKSELKKMLSIQLQDNTKARWINHERGVNIYKHTYGKSVRAQDTLYQYFQEKLKPSTETNGDKENEGK